MAPLDFTNTEHLAPSMASTIGYDDSDAGSTIDMSVGQTSAASVYSFSSSRDGSAMLRAAERRMYEYQDYVPFVPVDELEYSRLDKQHLVHLLMNDGLFARAAADKVRAVLDASNLTLDGTPRRVLDLGCGGGNWAISMALEFPHVEVVGIDLAPNTTRSPPLNCRFEYDDYNSSLERHYGMFDVVHARSCGNGVIDFEEFLNVIGLCLRPRGIALIIEGDLTLYSHLRERQEPANGDGDPSKSWMARMLTEVYDVMDSRDLRMDCNIHIHRYLCENPLYQDEDWTKLFSPIGPWERGRTVPETKKLETIGELMRQNSLAFVRALKPLLVSSGYPSEMVDRFIAGTDRELSEMSLHMYVKWHYAWAVRKEEEDHMSMPPDERPFYAATRSTSDGPAPWFPLTAGFSSPLEQYTTRSSHEQNMFNASPFMRATNRNEKMLDVEVWVADNNEGSSENHSDLGTEDESETDFVDADSDGDMDIESVTDA